MKKPNAKRHTLFPLQNPLSQKTRTSRQDGDPSIPETPTTPHNDVHGSTKPLNPRRLTLFTPSPPSLPKEPPIVHAARQKDHLAITHLLDTGSEINTRCPSTQRTPLHEVVASGSLTCVMILLSRGADIHAVDAEGSSALHLAAVYQHHYLLGPLLEGGADVDARDKLGRTVLMVAVIAGDMGMVTELMRREAKLEESDEQGRKAVHYAACLQGEEILRVLLDAGAEGDVDDEEDDTPLHLAAAQPPGNVEVVKLLLNRGAKPFARNKKGSTPAFIALVNCGGNGWWLDGFCTLIKAGGTVAGIWEGEDEEFGIEKALVLVSSWGKLVAGDGYVEVMRLLISKCERLDQRDKEGKSALHWAVQGDFVDVVQALLKKGASVDVKDDKGRTPLHVAIMGGIKDDTKKKEMIVRILLKYGADAKAKDGEGKTPLQKMRWWRSGRGMRTAFAQARR